MKVLMVNGSPHKNGCTQTALEEAASTIKEAGIDVDFFWIGNRPVQECIGCFACHKKNECVFNNDSVNDFVRKACDYDGFLFGHPCIMQDLPAQSRQGVLCSSGCQERSSRSSSFERLIRESSLPVISASARSCFMF